MRPSKILPIAALIFLTGNSARAETLWEMYQNAQQNPFGLKYTQQKSQEQIREENEHFRAHQENERRRQEKSDERFRVITNEKVNLGNTNCRTVFVNEGGQFVQKKLCE